MVEFTREQRASVYVMAEDEADLLSQIDEGLDDLPEDDWEISMLPSRSWSEATSSHGRQVWSGGEDGEWLDPVAP